MFKKKSKPSADAAVFPKNRWGVFLDVLLSRPLALFQVSMLTALFFLPFFLWNLYLLFALFGPNASLAENASNVLFLRLIQAGGNLILLPVAGVGVSGGIHVVRLMAYQEISFLKMDFKKGLHNGAKGDALAFFFLAIALDVFLLAYSFGASFGQLLSLFGVGAAGVFLVFVFILCLLDVMQNDLYTLVFVQRLQNSWGLLFSDLPVHLGYALLLLSANGCFYFFHLFYVAVGGAAFFLLLGLPLSMLLSVLWISWSLDRHINKSNFPSLYDKGIVRLPKKKAVDTPTKLAEASPEGNPAEKKEKL